MALFTPSHYAQWLNNKLPKSTDFVYTSSTQPVPESPSSEDDSSSEEEVTLRLTKSLLEEYRELAAHKKQTLQTTMENALIQYVNQHKPSGTQ